MTNCNVVDRYLDIPQGLLFVRQWAPRSQDHLPPIVLIHDSLGCVELWREFPEILATTLGRRVIAYDRLGFGKSSARAELPSVEFIEEEANTYFPILREALNLSEYLVFGHSIGGAMALLIAAADNKCKAAISVAGQVYVENRTLEGIKAAKESFRNPKQFEKLTKLHKDKANWVLSAWTEAWLSPDFADWNITAEIRAINCPVLVIHGDLDEFSSLASPEAIVKNISGIAKKEIFKDCGHVPHKERRAQLLESVSLFTSQLDK